MQRTYPAGVPSWIDLEPADLARAQEFYGGLFGWTFASAGGGAYLVAQLDGRDVAGFAPSQEGARSVWNTYIAVDDADRAVARIADAGGRVTLPPTVAGPSGRLAGCTDPAGVPFRLWEAAQRPGVQLTNEPGTWNFSDLHTADPAAAIGFFTDVFGWETDDVGFATMVRQPGYGDHLAATVDPTIHDRQSGIGAPPGFADAIAWLVPAAAEETPHWHVSFAVADRDETAAAVERLGGTVLAVEDTEWTREALVRDTEGAVFTASQFTPPEG